MRIEIIAIGNELLAGNTVNTNASFLSQKFLEKGYFISKHQVAPDDPEILKKVIEEAMEQNDLIIVCGGLGPTVDDLTKQILCDVFSQYLIIDEEIKEDLQQRFSKSLDIVDVKGQASVLKDATVLKNKVGTAPGMILLKGKKTLIALPGVPTELKPMFINDVLPYVEKHFSLKKKMFLKEIGIFHVPEMQVDPLIREIKQAYPDIQVGIYPSLGYVKVRFSFFSESKEQAEKVFTLVLQNIQRKFAKNLFENSIEEELHTTLIKQKKTLALAESCTGGSISSKITSLEGASKYFLGSIVCYANSIKEKILNVNSKTLQEKGAVSFEVVAQMLEGLFSISGADYGIAISGIAGPSGESVEKPVGTVFIGIASKEGIKDIGVVHMTGQRERIIEQSVNTSLGALLKRVKYSELSFAK